jgi:serine/threonine protein kinase
MPPSPESDETLFADALALPADERACFLDAACKDDAARRQRLDSLLKASESAKGFMESPPLAGQNEATAASLSSSGENAGQQIGRYKLLQKIGEGGCGIVYMAEQSEPVQRRVALKVIKLGMDTKAVVARFEAERQALALMDHPNIARVLDAGATETGRPFFVMELVRGLKITDYCDQHKFTTAQRLELFGLVCLAVQHAHQKGIIHRDLKPSNILVTLHDGVPVPKVIDFGIAKATQGRLTDRTLFTAFEQFIGTPAYMSPEQAELSSQDVDTRSDIYSLGVLLYELLTGKPPFDPQTFRQAGIDEIRRFIREVEPPKPSVRLNTLPDADSTTVARLRGTDAPRLAIQLKGDIDWIVMKALDKNRTRRYETAGALADDLLRHLHNEPVIARPPSAGYLLQKLIRRNRLAFTAATVVVASLVAGLGVATWSFIQEKAARTQEAQQRALAEAGEQKARIAAAKSKQAYKFIAGMLTGVGPSVAAGRDTVLLREILDKTVKRLNSTLKDQPEVELNLRQTLGAVYLDLGDFAKAEPMAREALVLAEKLYGRESEDVAGALILLGEIQVMQGHGTESEPLLREALAIARKYPGPQNENLAEALMAMGASFMGQGKLPEAETHCREALALVKQQPEIESLPVENVQMQLAFVLQKESRLAEAEPMFREVLAVQKKLLSQDDPVAAYTQLGLSNVLMLQGKLPEAETQFREALVVLKKALGDEHPTIAMIRLNLALILQQSGRLQEAETQYREVLALQKKVLGNEHPATRQTESMLALLLQMQRKSAEAEVVQQDSSAPQSTQAGNDEVAAAGKKADQAMAAMAQEKFDLAETNLREALPVFEKAFGASHQAVINTRFFLIQVLLRQNKPVEAEPIARDLLAVCRKTYGNNNNFVANALASLATSLQAQGKLTETETVLHESLSIAQAQSPDGKNPGVASVLLLLATVKAEQTKLDDRDRLVNEAAEMIRPLPDNLKAGLYKSVETVAKTLKDQGRHADAVMVEQVAVALVRNLFGTESDITAWALTTSAWMQNAAGQFTAGEASAREAAAIRRKLLPTDHWLVYAAEYVAGESLMGQKNYAGAEPLLRSVFAGMKMHGPENSDPLYSFWRDRMKYTANLLVQIYEATGQADKVGEWKKQAAEYTVPDAAKDASANK